MDDHALELLNMNLRAILLDAFRLLWEGEGPFLVVQQLRELVRQDHASHLLLAKVLKSVQ